MSHLFIYISLFVLLSSPVSGQKKWNGGGGDNRWINPLNWVGNTIPVSTDNVILDNSVIANSYIVRLPATAVTVRTITISPSVTDSIELVLPSQNTLVPGLIITGPGYGLVINNRGVFRNSSGAASGTPVSIADSIRINNGGRYVHNTARGHTSNIQVLSAIPGTETGIFEFDIPDPSTTISLSGRIFGKLVLSAVAAGGTLNYTAAGTSRVVVRSDLKIGNGVTCNLNFSDTIFIGADLLQDGGTFNLGNTTRTVVLSVKGNISQLQQGIITETGTGKPVLLLAGSAEQKINMKGTILNEVSFVKNGAGYAVLEAPLSLPYKLSLQNGKIITSQPSMLTLLSSCSIEADSIVGVSFIDGPMKKYGLLNQQFLFPVGKGGVMRWMALKASGNFTVEYFRNNPYSLSNTTGTGLHHLSELEYWNIFPDAALSPATSILSFNVSYSGGVTNLAQLRIARLSNGVWENAGNTGVTGTAGGNGSVSGISIKSFSTSVNYYALASATATDNPLPLSTLIFKAARKKEYIRFDWKMLMETGITKFLLQQSSDNDHFLTFHTYSTSEGIAEYQYEFIPDSYEKRYYRIIGVDGNDEHTFLSKTVCILPSRSVNVGIVGPTIAYDRLPLIISSPKQTIMEFIIYDVQGITRKKYKIQVHKGRTNTDLNITMLPSGLYLMKGVSPVCMPGVFRFIRK